MLFGTKLKRLHSPDLYVPHGVHIVRKYDGGDVAGSWQSCGRVVAGKEDSKDLLAEATAAREGAVDGYYFWCF